MVSSQTNAASQSKTSAKYCSVEPAKIATFAGAVDPKGKDALDFLRMISVGRFSTNTKYAPVNSVPVKSNVDPDLLG